MRLRYPCLPNNITIAIWIVSCIITIDFTTSKHIVDLQRRVNDGMKTTTRRRNKENMFKQQNNIFVHEPYDPMITTMDTSKQAIVNVDTTSTTSRSSVFVNYDVSVDQVANVKGGMYSSKCKSSKGMNDSTCAPETVAPIPIPPPTTSPITIAPVFVAPVTLAPIAVVPIPLTAAPIATGIPVLAPAPVLPIATQSPLTSLPTSEPSKKGKGMRRRKRSPSMQVSVTTAPTIVPPSAPMISTPTIISTNFPISTIEPTKKGKKKSKDKSSPTYPPFTSAPLFVRTNAPMLLPPAPVAVITNAPVTPPLPTSAPILPISTNMTTAPMPITTTAPILAPPTMVVTNAPVTPPISTTAPMAPIATNAPSKQGKMKSKDQISTPSPTLGSTNDTPMAPFVTNEPSKQDKKRSKDKSSTSFTQIPIYVQRCYDTTSIPTPTTPSPVLVSPVIPPMTVTSAPMTITNAPITTVAPVLPPITPPVTVTQAPILIPTITTPTFITTNAPLSSTTAPILSPAMLPVTTTQAPMLIPTVSSPTIISTNIPNTPIATASPVLPPIITAPLSVTQSPILTPTVSVPIVTSSPILTQPIPTTTTTSTPINPPIQQPITTTTAPVSIPVPVPVPVSSTNRYDILLDFDDASVPASDQIDFIAAKIRWEQIVIGDVVDVPLSDIMDYPPDVPGCSYPTTTGYIDDIYICVYYTQLSNGVIGQGGYNLARNNIGFPMGAFIRIDPDEIATAREFGYFNDLILHEIGHAMGIGTSGSCPSNNVMSRANLEYQQISQCSTQIPMNQPDCGHYLEDCLGAELMTPVAGMGDNPISRITIGWLDDLGYDVDYTYADPFDSSQLGTIAGCNCNRRQTQEQSNNVRYIGSMSNSSSSNTHRTIQQQQAPPALSTGGYTTAITSGLLYLQEQTRKSSFRGINTSSTVTYVGDKFVWVYIRENDRIYSVLVRP